MTLFFKLIDRFWLIITLILLSTITLLSLWPMSALPDVPGTDKTHHFIAYAALILPAALKQHQRLWLIVFVFVIYSGAIELIQPFVNRYGEWLDLAANATGLLCGVVIAACIHWLYQQFITKTLN